METKAKPERMGGSYFFFQGATINHMVINENYYGHHADQTGYSDEQVAQALASIVGDGKPIDSKQKWAGAQWLLRWECNYPAKAQDFCERIAQLPLPDDLEYKCDYRNIRELATLPFMDQDPRKMDLVQPSKNYLKVFAQCREVALKLDEALKNTQ